MQIHRDKDRYPEETEGEFVEICKDYHYLPKPWPSKAPYPHNEVWFFFQNPTMCGTTKKLSKKLPVLINDASSHRSAAFGIHVEERYSAMAIFVFGIIMCLLALGATAIFIPHWLKGHPDDLQNATVPAMLVLGVINTMVPLSVSLLVFRITNMIA